MQARAEMDARTPDGKTALMLAAKRGHTEVADALLQSPGPSPLAASPPPPPAAVVPGRLVCPLCVLAEMVCPGQTSDPTHCVCLQNPFALPSHSAAGIVAGPKAGGRSVSPGGGACRRVAVCVAGWRPPRGGGRRRSHGPGPHRPHVRRAGRQRCGGGAPAGGPGQPRCPRPAPLGAAHVRGGPRPRGGDPALGPCHGGGGCGGPGLVPCRQRCSVVTQRNKYHRNLRSHKSLNVWRMHTIFGALPAVNTTHPPQGLRSVVWDRVCFVSITRVLPAESRIFLSNF